MNLVFKALADPTRRAVLKLLRERAMTAGEIAEHFPFSRPTMSGHFAILAAAGLVEREKLGANVVYRLKISVLEDLLLHMMTAYDLHRRTDSSGDEPT